MIHRGTPWEEEAKKRRERQKAMQRVAKDAVPVRNRLILYESK
jgi:hypothetical protein